MIAGKLIDDVVRISNGNHLCFSVGHHLTVKKLCFRPVLGRAGYYDADKNNDNVLQLVSCSSDHSVRIYDVYLNK